MARYVLTLFNRKSNFLSLVDECNSWLKSHYDGMGMRVTLVMGAKECKDPSKRQSDQWSSLTMHGVLAGTLFSH